MKAHCLPSIRLYLAVTLLLGFGYPAAVWGVGRLAFPEEAGGSFLRRGGSTVGSSLIGQTFSSPKLFHGRPSAAGETGYDATASGGTNLGPTSRKLADAVRNAVKSVSDGEGVTGSVPADAVTSSGSGLDPHVSPDYARLQVPRVARQTGVPPADLDALIARRTEGRFLGVWGERRVNVLLLNLDLEKRLGAGGAAAR
ncbi:MAG TPA: potassium-transporting ATPase subunit KdpC [Thermoanaerobaculia bacterium]|nr:potassium-transporting ATPase subunit KdpC [Thermoanaerobaculia bacterium]